MNRASAACGALVHVTLRDDAKPTVIITARRATRLSKRLGSAPPLNPDDARASPPTGRPRRELRQHNNRRFSMTHARRRQAGLDEIEAIRTRAERRAHGGGGDSGASASALDDSDDPEVLMSRVTHRGYCGVWPRGARVPRGLVYAWRLLLWRMSPRRSRRTCVLVFSVFFLPTPAPAGNAAMLQCNEMQSNGIEWNITYGMPDPSGQPA